MLTIEYLLANSHQSLSASNFIILCNVSVSRDLLWAILEHTIRLATQVATNIQGMVHIMHNQIGVFMLNAMPRRQLNAKIESRLLI